MDRETFKGLQAGDLVKHVNNDDVLIVTNVLVSPVFEIMSGTTEHGDQIIFMGDFFDPDEWVLVYKATRVENDV
jgi:hypothetical protein